MQGGHAIVVASSGYNNFGAGVSPTTSTVLTANDTENFRGNLSDPTHVYGFDVLLSDFYTTTTVSFFNASNAMLGSLSFAADSNGTNNYQFAGITTPGFVSYFTFVSTGPNVQNSGIDNIRALPGSAPLPGAVPEPATWAMLLGGFVLIGLRTAAARCPHHRRSLLMQKISAVAIALAVCTLAATAPAGAAQVALTPLSVIGDTGSYNYPGTGHPGAFVAGNIFDQPAGPIVELFQIGYWINGDNGPAAAYITVDLGAAMQGLSFDLFNTANGPNGDRGTGAFIIVGANAVASDGANGFTLAGATTTLVNGTLTAETGAVPLSAQSFTAAAGSFRYLQFRPTSVASAVPIINNIQNNYGLNELRVFATDAVPEPATWALLIGGFAMTGVAMRRRERAAT